MVIIHDQKFGKYEYDYQLTDGNHDYDYNDFLNYPYDHHGDDQVMKIGDVNNMSIRLGHIFRM